MRYLTVVIGCVLMLAGTAWAQRPGGTERRGPSLEQRVAARVSILEEQVGGLTEEQKAKASEVYTRQLKEMGSVRQDTSLTPAQRREKLSEATKATEGAISAILTPEQKEKRRQAEEKPERAQPTGKEREPAGTTP